VLVDCDLTVPHHHVLPSLHQILSLSLSLAIPSSPKDILCNDAITTTTTTIDAPILTDFHPK
jgi:hypothetical protein